MARILIDHVSIVYDNWRERSRFLAVDDVSLEIDHGEFLVVVGPSGCGKTSLLNAVSGLLQPAEGTVTVDNRPIRGPGSDRALVFQEYALFPWLNVRENVRFGIELLARRADPADENRRVQQLIELVGLAGFERHFPHELSGGMRQRTGLARALAIQPEILLIDEPFAAIDAMTREVMQTELLKILSRTRQTVLFITHSIDEALILGDRVVAMSRRPGRVKKIITVPFLSPRWEHDARTDPRFGEMREHIWGLLRDEAEQAEEPVARIPG